MENLIFPSNYKALLDPKHTERAILKLKDAFQTNLAYELNLTRVTAPLFVRAGTGVNDDLNGVERPVSFKIGHMNDEEVQVVQSLAKWKRMALANLGFNIGEGLYTDMNAIRPDDPVDSTHSLYVDQWDWEIAITRENRNLDFLRSTVRKIYDVIRRTERFIGHEYDELTPYLPDEIHFVYSEDLLRDYPHLSPKEREYKVCKELGAVFVIGIGGELADGSIHDGRAPDYDDWSTPTGDGHIGLNGDILVYNRTLDMAFELSSMGIRVDVQALENQLKIRDAEDRRELYFHKRLLDGSLPLSLGGGIGQSRLSMLLLQKAHIGEIQTSIWPDEMITLCKENGINLL
ncbi:MAG TPA: aspartate--ammonia ligase [Spirochaeta sp.]|nr:aspartate--ammonia ligase [Spirochaeta sp.]